MSRVDINVDIAEGFPWDTELIKVATSANVCCGVHAGLARAFRGDFRAVPKRRSPNRVHPGYADRPSMGRTSITLLDISEEALVESLWEQVEPYVFVASYLKPHGALYHDSASVPMSARSLTLILERSRLPLWVWPKASMPTWPSSQACPLFGRVSPTGGTTTRWLVPRSEADALLTSHEEIERQVARLALSVDSICVHGDGEVPNLGGPCRTPSVGFVEQRGGSKGPRRPRPGRFDFSRRWSPRAPRARGHPRRRL